MPVMLFSKPMFAALYEVTCCQPLSLCWRKHSQTLPGSLDQSTFEFAWFWSGCCLQSQAPVSTVALKIPPLSLLLSLNTRHFSAYP